MHGVVGGSRVGVVCNIRCMGPDGQEEGVGETNEVRETSPNGHIHVFE